MDNKINLKDKIFIGGTGRSGTTLLYTILGEHPRIHSFKDELRFIIDPKGLINLTDSLTKNFSPSQAGIALYDFKKLMLQDLRNLRTSPYPWCDLGSYLGGGRFEEIVQNFLDNISHGTFDGSAAWFYDEGHKGITHLKRRVNNRLPIFSDASLKKTYIPIGKYFENREMLLTIVRNFLSALFDPVREANGSNIWCEKTAYNALHFDFLSELFPDTLFIHIKRDPRSVVMSYMKQTWAPSDVKKASYMVKSVLKRIIHQKENFKGDYFEVKLEDFVLNPHKVLLNNIEDYFDLKTSFPMNTSLNPQRVMAPILNIDGKVKDQINDILKEEIIKMGYEY